MDRALDEMPEHFSIRSFLIENRLEVKMDLALVRFLAVLLVAISLLGVMLVLYLLILIVLLSSSVKKQTTLFIKIV